MPVLAAPPGPLVLNNEHPLTYLLTDCRIFGAGTVANIAPNLVTRYPVNRNTRLFNTNNTASPTIVTIDGIKALNFVAASSQAMTSSFSNAKYAVASRASTSISVFGFSVGVIGSLGSSTANLRNLYGNCSGYTRYTGISGAASADKWVAQFAGNGGYEQLVTSTNTFATDKNYAVLGTLAARALIDLGLARVWVDGSLEGTSTSAYTGGETGDYILVGATNSGTNYHNGTLSLGCIWARELHGHEAALWGRDPWGMFRPSRSWNVMAPAVGGGAVNNNLMPMMGVGD